MKAMVRMGGMPRNLLLVLATFCASPGAIIAQTQPTTLAPPLDPQLEAAQKAFEALPEPERRAIQNDLTWAVPYSGAALGTFGKLTFDALKAFQASHGGGLPGLIDARQRRKLAEEADRARAAWGFRVTEDPNTGSGIGLASALMGQPEKTASGSKWTAGTNLVLETVRTKPDKADMAATFGRFVNAAVPGRKVTYKLLRPDFFVVSGEIGPQKFYTRFAPTPDGLRGYTLTYSPDFRPDVERLVIATANTFEPLATGGAGVAAPQAGKVASTAEAVANAAPAAPKAGAASAQSGSGLSGSGLVIGKGAALAPAMLGTGCKSLTVNGRAAQASAASDGVIQLASEGLDAALPVNYAEAQDGEAATVFGFGPDHKLLAAPGRFSGNGKQFVAALQPGLAGGVIVSASGAVLGLIGEDPALKPQLNGVTLASAYRVQAARPPETPAQNAAASGQAALSTGALAQRAAQLVVSVACQR